MNWKSIDIDSYRKEKDIEEKGPTKINFDIEDEDGNSIGEDLKEENIVLSDEDNQKEEIQVGNEEDEEDNKKEKVSKTKKEVDGTTEEVDGKTKSRAQDRIRELVRQKKEQEQSLTQQINELKQRLSATTVESVSVQKEHLEARIADVKRAAITAQEEGRFAEATDFMSTLNDLQTKKTVIDAHAEKMKQPASKTSTPEETDDTEALAFVVRNRGWWEKDAVKTTLAVKLSKKLSQEGLDPTSREFYDELSERIKEFIGEEENETSSQEEDLQSSSKQEVKTLKKPPQTTSGASRTPTASKAKKLTITLTKEERQMAQQMGITELNWAKRKYQAAKLSDENGYQTVF